MGLGTVLIATEKPFAQDARDAAVQIIEDGGLEVKLLENYTTKQQLIDALHGIECHIGLIVRSDIIDEEVLDAASGLKLVVRAGAGYDNIKHIYAEQKGIKVGITPGVNANAVAEHAFHLMQDFIRPIDGGTGTELRGKTLGIHGFGNVGKYMAEIAKGHGMDVVVYDIFLDGKKAEELGVRVARTPEELYNGANFISLNIPQNSETKKSIGYELFKLMSANGAVVNTAREGIIDYDGLIRAFEEKNIGYTADVPPQADVRANLEEKMGERVFMVKKKQGAETKEANYEAATAAANLCVKFSKEGILLTQVNNPLPDDMWDYVTLAQYLGRFNTAFVERPNSVEVTCYGRLEKFQDHFGRYVLKGLFQDQLGKELTPSEASEAAKERGIELLLRKPDNKRGHGDSITVEYVYDGTAHSIRGRIDEKELQVQRIGDFRMTIPLEKGIYVIAQYQDGAGKSDVIGDKLSSKGYNKIVGGFRQEPMRNEEELAENQQEPTVKRAMMFCRINPNGDALQDIARIVESEIKSIPGVYRALTVNMG